MADERPRIESFTGVGVSETIEQANLWLSQNPKAQLMCWQLAPIKLNAETKKMECVLVLDFSMLDRIGEVTSYRLVGVDAEEVKVRDRLFNNMVDAAWKIGRFSDWQVQHESYVEGETTVFYSVGCYCYAIPENAN